MTIKEIDEKIKELEAERIEIIRARIITVGDLLDLHEKLDKSSSEIQWHVGFRLAALLEKLGGSEDNTN